jgi:ubiquinone/menaquinone biosynthesis C-methylase UbiE
MEETQASGLSEEKQMDPLARLLRDLHGGTILDVAAGCGGFLRFMCDSFLDYSEAIGIDISNKLFAAHEGRMPPRSRFEVADATALPFADHFFDTVGMRHSLHHLAAIDLALGDMFRVLKPGGLMIIAEPFQSPETNFSNAQRHLHHWWAAVDRQEGINHNETFTKDRIARIVAMLDLEDTQQYEYQESCDDQKMSEILGNMLERTLKTIERLKAEGHQPDLVQQGIELIARFQEQGLVAESVLYIVGRKPK